MLLDLVPTWYSPLRPSAVIRGDPSNHGGRGGTMTHGLGRGIGVTLDDTSAVALTTRVRSLLHIKHLANNLPANRAKVNTSKTNTQTQEGFLGVA